MPVLTLSATLHSYPINHLLRNYPNPFATHVVSVDTVSREIDPETGIMRSSGSSASKQGAPAWITKVSTRRQRFFAWMSRLTMLSCLALPPVAYVEKSSSSIPGPQEQT